MPDLRDTRRNVKIVIAVLVLIDIAAAGLLYSPLVGSSNSRRLQMEQLWAELQQKTKQVQPLLGMDKKVVLAKQQIDGFYKDRIDAQDSMISDALGKMATQTGVRINGAKYKVEDPQPVGVRRVLIEADLSGDYLQIVRFINALERSKVLFVIDSVTLAEENGPVKLQMKMESYLRTAS